MKNKLTNEEIARVFAMYYGKKTDAPHPYDIVTGTMIDYISVGMLKMKLQLTPLSLISDEDAVEVAKMEDSKNINRGYEWLSRKGKVLAYQPLKDVNAYQYLISKCYAVPLFFGINHWANGKTAIELGIAIDKTKI
ncbi:MAG TPA: hypothetical protein PLD02_14640 [Saprospiraceae bacterium]|nr:hypothetical protein [Saprospiraceae bacterium]